MLTRTVPFTACLATVATLLLWPLAGLAAPGPLAQLPILSAASTKSNIMIVIDDSGSMGWGSGPPMAVAKNAAVALLDSLSNVRVGVGSFSRSWPSGLELDHPVADLDANRASIKKAIMNLRARGGTPLVETMQQTGRYFVGTGGDNNPGNHGSTSCTANGYYSGKLTLKPGRGDEKYNVKEVFPRKPEKGESIGSPICHWCQKNFLILLTDGWGWGGPSRPLRGRYCPGCWHGMISVAKALNEVDLRPDIDNFKGEEVTNNLVTYTIGFHTSQNLLRKTAEAGGGLYLEADTPATLKAAFAKIGEDIVAHTRGSSSAASFNTASLKAGGLIYLTRFDTENWTGDVMAAPYSSAGVGSQKWSAANRLNKSKPPGSRTLLTYNNSDKADMLLCPGVSGTLPKHHTPELGGVPFRWNKIADRQLGDLLVGATSSSAGLYSYAKKWGTQGTAPGQFRLAFDIATDTKGDVYVADYNNHRIQKFDKEGALQGAWGEYGFLDENLIYPSGIAIDSERNVYVAQHTSHSIKKFDMNGNFLMTMGGYPDLYYPFDVAVDAELNIYVVELQNHQIKVLDKTGKLLRTMGRYGSGNGQFKYPNRIAIDEDDNLYVSDYLNHRVQKFDSAGNFLRTWGSYGTGNGQFRYPYGIDTDSKGDVFVVEYENRVQQFDAEGVFKAKFADKTGTKDGELRYPRGIAVYDGSGCGGSSFYVADAYNHRVQKFVASAAMAVNVSVGKGRLDYLRGDRLLEGGLFRKRDSLLGDIIHSSAVHVGKLDLRWPAGGKFPDGSDSYAAFIAGIPAKRGEMVYVGANDGMLHGFDANTGDEVLGYLPGNLFTDRSSEGYHYLTDHKYGHRYYVDATPTVSEAFIKSKFVSKKSWRTVLVSGLGAGGRGVFALDVTDPRKFKESEAKKLVLWEFTDKDDLQLGYTLARPTVALMPNGRWAAILGNGYNNKDPSGEAVLFILFLDGGLDGEWKEGDDYVKIPIRGIGDAANPNGLSTPAIVDTNGDKIADRAYAGDIHANLWVFDLSNENPKKWHSKKLLDTMRSQPITVKPEVIRHPAVPTAGNVPNMLVFFGTGQYLVAGDNTTTNRQSFYAVWDRGDTNLRPDKLVKQVFASSPRSNGRVIERNRWKKLKVNYKNVAKGDRYGWYLDLPASGERVVTDARIRGKLIYFNTLIPGDPRPCATGGTGWLMSVEAVTGDSPRTPAFDFDGDGKITPAGDSCPGFKSKLGYAGVQYQSSGGVPTGLALIGNKRVTGGTGTDTPASLAGGTGSGTGTGTGTGSGSGSGSGSGTGTGSGASNNADNTLEDIPGGPTGRLSWSQLSY